MYLVGDRCCLFSCLRLEASASTISMAPLLIGGGASARRAKPEFAARLTQEETLKPKSSSSPEYGEHVFPVQDACHSHEYNTALAQNFVQWDDRSSAKRGALCASFIGTHQSFHLSFAG